MRPTMKVGFAAIFAMCLGLAACTKKEEAPVEQVPPPAATAPVDPNAPQQLDPGTPPPATPAPHGEPSSSLMDFGSASLA